MRKTMRFTALVVTLGLLLCCCGRRNEPVPSVKREQTAFAGTIICVGDSLTAGYGVKETDAYPAQLENKLRSGGYRWRVINAGISGETSSGTRSRIAWLLNLKPDIVILETGANDGLREIDPKVTQKNIEEIVRILKNRSNTSAKRRRYTTAAMATFPVDRRAARNSTRIQPQRPGVPEKKRSCVDRTIAATLAIATCRLGGAGMPRCASTGS